MCSANQSRGDAAGELSSRFVMLARGKCSELFEEGKADLTFASTRHARALGNRPSPLLIVPYVRDVIVTFGVATPRA